MMTSVNHALGSNTPTIGTVVGVGPWTDKRARVHQGPLTRPQVRFPISDLHSMRGGVARSSRVFGVLKFTFPLPQEAA